MNAYHESIHEAEATHAYGGTPGQGRRSGWKRMLLVGVTVAAIAAWGASRLVGSGEAAPAPPPLPSVTVAAPLHTQISEWDDYVGRFEASKSVEIRPRVGGQLVAIHFHDGDIVAKGQLLFTVDPRPYQAAVDQARSRVLAARTAISLANAQLARAAKLVGEDAVSADEVDTLRAAAESARAQLAGAEADLRARALDLEFTQVRAPIAGRVSDRRVDVGNLVAAGQGGAATLLTTVYALDPIYFVFEGSEGLYLKTQRDQSGGSSELAQIKLQDEDGYRWQGRVDFTDNGIDPSSGTIRSRAVVANAGLFLKPGMFGNMRLGTGAVTATLIPDTAVQTDQTRKSLFVVGADGVAVAREVKLGATTRGLRVVRSGLKDGDRIVIRGAQLISPGMKVKAQAGRISPEKEDGGDGYTLPASSQATLDSSAL